MTVKELHKELKRYMRNGWKDKPIYISNSSIIDEVHGIEKYSLNDFIGLHNEHDEILMIK